MSQVGVKPKPKVYKIQIYNVPESWVEELTKRASKLGLSVSDYVKVYILEPWFREVAENEGA